MAGSRVETAKEALKLFLRSLPVGCSFSLISFGSHSEVFQLGSSSIFKYNDETSAQVISKLMTFKANLGGTNILQPLERALNDIPNKSKTGQSYCKRIFLLTDG